MRGRLTAVSASPVVRNLAITSAILTLTACAFLRRSPKVRGQHDIVHLQQRRVDRRLLEVYIERGTCEMIYRIERLEEERFLQR